MPWVPGQVPFEFSSAAAGPGGGSAAQVMSPAMLPVFRPFLLVVLVLARMAVVRGAGSPAGQEVQGVLRGRPRLGGVGEQALTGIGSQRERLERQLQVPDDRVMDDLHAGGMDPDVVGPTVPGNHRCGWTARRSGPTAAGRRDRGRPRRAAGRPRAWLSCPRP